MHYFPGFKISKRGDLKMADSEKKELAVKQDVSLANLDELLDAEVQTALQNIDPRPPRIKMSREAQAFLLPDGSTEKALEGVIVYHHKARGYWETEGQQLPTCSSMDGLTGTGEDRETVACASCSFNQWGSGKDGRGKACKEMRWIYVLQDGEMIPSRISLPPTSLGSFDAFVTALAQRKIAPIMKRVRIGLEKTERHGFTYSVLGQPEVLGDVEREKIVEMLQLRDSVVAAAKKAGIEADDYFVDGDGDGAVGGSGGDGDDGELY